VRTAYCYCIIFLSISCLFPVTPRICNHLIANLAPATPFAAEMGRGDETAAITSTEGAERERIVTVDPGMTYIGDDIGVGVVYNKQFTVRAVGSKNILSLQVAGMVGARNDNDSQDYRHGFYTNKLFLNGNYIDNINNYVSQEEDEQFRTILVPLPAASLLPGSNKLTVMATGPKDGNHDDFAVREIKLLQW
jgi:hypothetical protein